LNARRDPLWQGNGRKPAGAARGRVLLAATLLAALLVGGGARPARADMSTHFGLSPRAIGLANAVSAVIDDYSGVYYNPAALAVSGASAFTLGYLYNAPRVKVRTADGAERTGFNTDLKAGLLGYRQNLKGMLPEKLDRNVVVGLALAYPGNFKTATLVRTRKYYEEQFPVFGRVPDMLVMSGGLGLEIHRTVYLGASMRYAVTYSAKDMTVRIRVLEGENVFEKVDVNAETEIQPIAGILVRPWEPLRIAAVWRRGGAPVKIVGRGGGSASLGPLELPIQLNLSFQDFYTPDEFAGSVAWWPRQDLLLAVECTYARWSGYDDPFGSIPPGEPFHDIVIPRFGVETVLCQALRLDLGYYWRPSPVKTYQPATQYLDTDEHVFSVALGYALPIGNLLQYPLVFSAYFQFQYLPERTLYTVDGPVADPARPVVTPKSVWGTSAGVGGTVALRF